MASASAMRDCTRGRSRNNVAEFVEPVWLANSTKVSMAPRAMPKALAAVFVQAATITKRGLYRGSTT